MPLIAAVALAGLWPLTAYRISPLVLPGLLVVVGMLLLVLARPEFGLALALALAPWINMQLGGVKPFQLLLPALVLAVLLYALLVRHGDGGRRAGALPVTIFLWLVAAVMSSLLALDPAASEKKLVIVITAAALFFATAHLCRTPTAANLVLGGAMAGLLLMSAQGVLQKILGRTGEFGIIAGGEVVGRVQGSFGHPNQYGGYIAVMIPLAVALMLTRAFPAGLRWLAGSALLLALPALTFSYARGPILALVLGSLLWLAVLRPRLAVLVAIVIALAAGLFAPAAQKERFDPSGRGDITLRADIWQAAIDIYEAHPLLGAGLNNFSRAYERLPATLEGATQRRLLHQTQVLVPPHAQNLYLNTLAEQGIVGLGVLVLLLGSALLAFFSSTRVPDPRVHALGLAGGAGLATLAVHSTLEVTLIGEVALPLFGLFALAWALGPERRPTARA